MSPRTLSRPAHVPIVDDAPMRFDQYVDRFIEHKQRFGDFNSPATLRSYRGTLYAHAEDVDQRDPANTTREHVLTTLSRWDGSCSNTLGTRLSHLRSFYRWFMQQGGRKDNPADQVPDIKRRASNTYRFSREEVIALWDAARTTREKRIVRLGIGAGLRRGELLGMQGRHFERPGFIWVSPDIGKGGKGRWIPVIGDLEDVVADIRETVSHDEYVIPARRWRDWGEKRRQIDHPHLPSSPQSLKTAMENLGKRAGIKTHITPHLMRHAFGDHTSKRMSIKVTQEALGHADISTTQRVYTGKFTPDEMAEAFAGFSFLDEQAFPTPQNHPEIPREAPTRIELVQSSSRLILPPDVYRNEGRSDSQ